MYRLNETEIWREHRRRLLREAEHHPTRRNRGSHTGPRVVRVPGGFAYVEERSATERDQR